MSFLSDIQDIRDRARQKIEDGPVTSAYPLNKDKAIGILNEALATEIVCVLRYKRHYYMATGIHSTAVAAEFLEHAKEEQAHADQIAERITQLGGEPDLNPAHASSSAAIPNTSRATSLIDMIREDLVAERIAIESYREIIQFFGDKDPTSRTLMESILAKEEEHADDLADLLFAIGPDEHAEPTRLYSSDEVPGKAGGRPAAIAREDAAALTARPTTHSKSRPTGLTYWIHTSRARSDRRREGTESLKRIKSLSPSGLTRGPLRCLQREPARAERPERGPRIKSEATVHFVMPR